MQFFIITSTTGFIFISVQTEVKTVTVVTESVSVQNIFPQSSFKRKMCSSVEGMRSDKQQVEVNQHQLSRGVIPRTLTTLCWKTQSASMFQSESKVKAQVSPSRSFHAGKLFLSLVVQRNKNHQVSFQEVLEGFGRPCRLLSERLQLEPDFSKCDYKYELWICNDWLLLQTVSLFPSFLGYWDFPHSKCVALQLYLDIFRVVILFKPNSNGIARTKHKQTKDQFWLQVLQPLLLALEACHPPVA